MIKIKIKIFNRVNRYNNNKYIIIVIDSIKEDRYMEECFLIEED